MYFALECLYMQTRFYFADNQQQVQQCMYVFMNMQKIHGISLCIVHKQQQHLNDDDDDDGREKNGFVVVTHR